MTITEAAAVFLAGGGGTIAYQAFAGWLKARGEQHRVDREVDAKVDEQRGGLAIDLLSVAREELRAFRDEATSLRPLLATAAHLDEALDHLHAVLNADGEEELKAAHRRAKAFLRRMRPEIGDLRQAKQRAESVETITGAVDHEGTDTGGRLARQLDSNMGGKS